jgi:hypothetical protein
MQSLLESLAGMKGAKFASFTYTAKAQKSGPRLTDETARHVVILGASTEELYKRDVVALVEMMPTLKGMELDAARKVLASRTESLVKGIGNNSAYTNADTYAPTAIAGVKVHRVTGQLHVTGLAISKVVLTAGEYRTVNSKPETIARQAVEARLPSAKFRQFSLDGVAVAKLNGETLELK